MRALLVILAALPALSLSGQTFGLFSYSDNGTYITITDYPEDATGTVVIPDTINGKPVQAIGANSFLNCASIIDVTISNSVQVIYSEAFGNCQSLASVTFGNSVTTIWSRAFADCGSLTSIILPDSVLSIGDHCFYGCTSMETVSIGSSLYGLGYLPFRGCPMLSSFSVDPGNSFFKSIDGVLYNRHEDTLITYPPARPGNFVIPGSVTNIGEAAFSDCSLLTGITIPNSVGSVPSFQNCTSLASVSIGNAITSLDNYAFQGCSSLAEIVIPDSVTSVGLSAFRFCSALSNVTLSNSLTSIGGSMFYRCHSLSEITIPNSVTSIETYAFYECTALEGITIPNSVTSIGGSAFSGCSKLAEVHIPSSVASIGYLAFHGCDMLASIVVDAANAQYTSLDGVLFDKGLSVLIKYPETKAGEYVIPGTVTEIEGSAFFDASMLTGITIPGSVSTMGTYAFQNCTSLTELSIPNGVASIGSYAFYNCNSLSGSVEIPASVSSIGSRVFHLCTELQSITVDPANAKFSSINGVLYNKAQTTLIDCPDAFVGPHTVPGTTTSIDRYAFQSCRGLTEIHMPNSITTLLLSSFKECTSLTTVTLSNNLTNIGPDCFRDCTALTQIAVPSSVTTIGYNAFQDCANLTTATIPATVSSFGTRVFSGCSKLAEITYPDSKTSLAFKDLSFNTELTSITLPAATSSINSSALTYCPKLATINIHPANTSLKVEGGMVFTFDGTTLVRCPPALNGPVTLPDTVTSINAGAFDDCTSITAFVVDSGNPSYSSSGGVLFNKGQTTLIRCPASLSGSYHIPATVTTIENGAFAHCPNLTSFSVDPANTEYSSLAGVLFNKDQTTLIRCPGGYSGSFEIPSTTSALNSDAFDDCLGMNSIMVAAGNANFSSHNGILYSFDQTELLKCPTGYSGSLSILPDVTSIGANAFRNCTGMTGVSLPPSLSVIGANAFLSCTGLTSVIIPESVTQLSWTCFFNCDSLNTIIFLGDAPTLNGYGSLFSTTSGDPTINHFNDSIGFPSINWKGYPVASMGEGTGIKKWLINEGFSHNQDTGSDLNGDGVTLLTAYALNLNPHENLALRMPRGVVNGSNLEMEFFAAAEGINYSVECSDNLINWTTTGINLSPVDPVGMRTAALPIQPGKRFMRLVMAE